MQKTQLPPRQTRYHLCGSRSREKLSRQSVNCANSHEINIKQIGRKNGESICSHNNNASITMQMKKKDNVLKKYIIQGEAIFV